MEGRQLSVRFLLDCPLVCLYPSLHVGWTHQVSASLAGRPDRGGAVHCRQGVDRGVFRLRPPGLGLRSRRFARRVPELGLLLVPDLLLWRRAGAGPYRTAHGRAHPSALNPGVPSWITRRSILYAACSSPSSSGASTTM